MTAATRPANTAGLATYASSDALSRGRLYPEPRHPYRDEFQRDRDRVVHSTAFRRLVYKTQVFVNHEGDMYRTRLTHSLEVAQIGRTIARALNLNEALAEAICLAHDLGHTAFGHAGQDALNECMRDYGGFEHNLQSLRVVDELEERYAEFPGLNLTFETREGILKHCSRKNAKMLGPIGERFLNRTQPGLEAQLANRADEIAYNSHDVDDGLRAGLLTVDALADVAIFRRHLEAVRSRYPLLSERRLIYQIVRHMINEVVTDLIEETKKRIATSGVESIDDVRQVRTTLVGLSERVELEHQELKQFLRRELYQHFRVVRMTTKARRTLTHLFESFMADVRLLPPEHANRARGMESESGESGRARAIADYLAGMTDRFAIAEYERLNTPGERT